MKSIKRFFAWITFPLWSRITHGLTHTDKSLKEWQEELKKEMGWSK